MGNQHGCQVGERQCEQEIVVTCSGRVRFEPIPARPNLERAHFLE